MFSTPEQSRAAVRAGGHLALAVSALGAVLVLAVSRWSGPDSVLLLGWLALVAGVGAFSGRFPERVPVPLTALLNRRGLAGLAAELAPTGPVSRLLVDVDHFKQVNDQYGHSVGDAVLIRLAEALRDQAGPADLVARLGGEEFALVLPGCDAAEAVRLAERLRRQVGEASSSWPAPLTLSVGTATGRGVLQLPELLGAADRALYAAKAAGRNTVRSA